MGGIWGFSLFAREKMNESEVVFVAVFGQLSPENVIEPRKTMEKLTNKKESEMGIGPIIGSMSQQTYGYDTDNHGDGPSENLSWQNRIPFVGSSFTTGWHKMVLNRPSMGQTYQ